MAHPRRRLLTPPGSDERVDLRGHQPLSELADHLPQQIVLVARELLAPPLEASIVLLTTAFFLSSPPSGLLPAFTRTGKGPDADATNTAFDTNQTTVDVRFAVIAEKPDV